MILDHGVGQAQAETGAPSDGFGCKEGIENLPCHRRRNALAAVGQ